MKINLYTIAFCLFLFNFVDAQNCANSTFNLKDSLVGKYNFNGSANDSSGYDNHGTSLATLTNDRFGNIGYAYQFGFQKAITIANPVQQRAPIISVSLWFRADTNSVTNSNIFSCSGYSLYLSKYSGNVKLSASIVSSGGSINGFAGNNLNDTTWHMAVMTYDTDTFRIYLDNTKSFEDTIIGGTQPIVYSTTGLTSRFGNFTTGSSFYGKIDDVRIYSRILNECDIDSLFNEPSPPTSTLSIFNQSLASVDFNCFVADDHQLFVSLTNKERLSNQKMELYNSTGLLVKTAAVTEKSIDCSDLSGGIYILRIGNTSKKIRL